MPEKYENPTFWEVDDAVDDIKVRDTVVSTVSTRDVAEFARRHHYTGSAGNAAWRWGLWHGTTLLGTVAYNLPTRESQASVFGEEHLEHVWHMGRLVMDEAAPRNSESRLISLSLKAITRDHPNVWAVLTFAAMDAGHIGYVYQATNAIYTGVGGYSIYYTNQRGERMATSHVSQAQARAKGWEVHHGLPKHRYLYVLGSKTERRQRMKMLKFEQLPYPKPPKNVDQAS